MREITKFKKFGNGLANIVKKLGISILFVIVFMTGITGATTTPPVNNTITSTVCGVANSFGGIGYFKSIVIIVIIFVGLFGMYQVYESQTKNAVADKDVNYDRIIKLGILIAFMVIAVVGAFAYATSLIPCPAP